MLEELVIEIWHWKKLMSLKKARTQITLSKSIWFSVGICGVGKWLNWRL